MRRKVSENSKGNERDPSKDARERQRKEVGHTGVELFCSSSVCCSLVLHWRVSVIVTTTRLLLKVSPKSLGQTEDSWFSSTLGKNTQLLKLI